MIPDFLSPSECDHLIKLARPKLQPSTVVDDTQEKGSKLDYRRTSQGTFFSRNSKNKTLRTIEDRIAELTNFPKENGEDIQVLFYGIGGEYRPHHDYFNPATPGGASYLRDGGQRVITLIMYLNTPEEGGETVFPNANVSVTPKKGYALLFYNCLSTGDVDPSTLHGGVPVKAGEKWIATKWLRQRDHDPK